MAGGESFMDSFDPKYGRKRKKKIGSVQKHPHFTRKSNIVKKNASSRRTGKITRLAICGLLFAVLTATNILLPEWSADFNHALRKALNRNMDVEAVFSAVGNIFTGTANNQTLTQAVFGENPDTAVAVQKSVLMQETATMAGTALEALQGFQKEAESLERSVERKSEEQLIYTTETLPDNVCMEQSLLELAYTAPAQGPVSSGFGYRNHPTDAEKRFHYGVDLAAERGSDVVAFADGTVTLIGESTSYGKYCMVSHPNGYQTLYAHCDRVTASSGDQVTLGQKLGEVGDTGITTGAHLHFELQKDGTYYNPIYYVT